MDQHQDILYRSFKVQLYPTEEQKIMIQKHFDARRFIWNHYLGKIKDSMNKDEGYIHRFKNDKDLTQLKKQEGYEWLNEVCSVSLHLTLKDLDEAFQSFFKKINNFPKFKTKKKPENNYTTYLSQRNGPRRITNNHIQLPKIGLVKRSKSKEYLIDLLQSKDNILVTISKSNTDKYYCSILVPIEDKDNKLNKHYTLDWDNAVGIDVGIKTLATLSDGTKYESYKTDKHIENKIRKLQQALSRKTSGSTKYKKTRKRLAKTKSKVNNQRKAYIDNIAVSIVKKYDYIYTEDISVNEWYQEHKHGFNKAIDESNVYQFLTTLHNKSKAYGKVCYTIDRYYPSTKTCSHCGYINNDLTLDDREWICPICDTKHDRDINAAINILNRGKELYSADLLLDYVDMSA